MGKIGTRAVLSPGNSAKPCKFRYVKPVGNFIRKIYRSKEKTRIFDDRTIAFDTTSPANPNEYLHRQKPHIIFAAGSMYASPSILKQSGFKTGAYHC